MTVLITLTVAGADSGPFNLYSNTDGFVSAFETGVSKAALLAGYSSALVPNFTTVIRVLSTGDCTNYIDITLDAPVTTTTSTTTIAPTTTTTTTPGIPCDTYQMVGVSDAPGCPGFVNYTYTDCLGVVQTGGSFSYLGTEFVCAQSTPTITCGSATISNLGTCLP
jgi:hypothetical protein